MRSISRSGRFASSAASVTVAKKSAALTRLEQEARTTVPPGRVTASASFVSRAYDCSARAASLSRLAKAGGIDDHQVETRAATAEVCQLLERVARDRLVAASGHGRDRPVEIEIQLCVRQRCRTQVEADHRGRAACRCVDREAAAVGEDVEGAPAGGQSANAARLSRWSRKKPVFWPVKDVGGEEQAVLAKLDALRRALARVARCHRAAVQARLDRPRRPGSAAARPSRTAGHRRVTSSSVGSQGSQASVYSLTTSVPA